MDKWSICWREVSPRGFALQYCIHCYSPKLSPTCAFPLVQMRGVVLFSKDFAMGLCPQGWCWGAGRSGMAISYGVEVAHPGSALHTPIPSIPRLRPNKGCSDPGCRFGENKSIACSWSSVIWRMCSLRPALSLPKQMHCMLLSSGGWGRKGETLSSNRAASGAGNTSLGCSSSGVRWGWECTWQHRSSCSTALFGSTASSTRAAHCINVSGCANRTELLPGH